MIHKVPATSLRPRPAPHTLASGLRLPQLDSTGHCKRHRHCNTQPGCWPPSEPARGPMASPSPQTQPGLWVQPGGAPAGKWGKALSLPACDMESPPRALVHSHSVPPHSACPPAPCPLQCQGLGQEPCGGGGQLGLCSGVHLLCDFQMSHLASLGPSSSLWESAEWKLASRGCGGRGRSKGQEKPGLLPSPGHPQLGLPGEWGVDHRGNLSPRVQGPPT